MRKIYRFRKWAKYLAILFLLFLALPGQGQDVYKTPSGKKYHLSTCSMVENVSAKLVGKADIAAHGLSPCFYCKPPATNAIVRIHSEENKAVGESESVQCSGTTKAGNRCRHSTKIANGYCYQHTSQAGSTRTYQRQSTAPTSSSTCGARTKSGGYCKRRVKNGGRCYQH